MTTNTNIRCVTWYNFVYQALLDLGGKAHLSKIYNRVREMRRKAGRSLPKSLENIVRTTLEDRCNDAYFRTGKDIFWMPKGKGAGVWAIRPNSVVVDFDIDDFNTVVSR